MNYTKMAENTLRQDYGINEYSLTFLRQSENAIFKVETSERQYVLRLHIQKDGLNVQHDIGRLESEMKFLKELHKHSSLRVQCPIETKSSCLYAQLPNNTFASLLTWLDGDNFDPSHKDAAEHAHLVGEMISDLRAFTTGRFDINSLPHPAYDSQRVMQVVDALKDGIDIGLYTASQYEDLLQAAQCICKEMDAANLSEGTSGLIHGDLGPGNIIMHNGTASPIDFGRFSHGPYLLDLSGFIASLKQPHLRKAALEGYSKRYPLSNRDYYSICTFILAGIYLFMHMILHNTYGQKWFGLRLPDIISEYVHPIINGESFLDAL